MTIVIRIAEIISGLVGLVVLHKTRSGQSMGQIVQGNACPRDETMHKLDQSSPHRQTGTDKKTTQKSNEMESVT